MRNYNFSARVWRFSLENPTKSYFKLHESMEKHFGVVQLVCYIIRRLKAGNDYGDSKARRTVQSQKLVIRQHIDMYGSIHTANKKKG